MAHPLHYAHVRLEATACPTSGLYKRLMKTFTSKVESAADSGCKLSIDVNVHVHAAATRGHVDSSFYFDPRELRTFVAELVIGTLRVHMDSIVALAIRLPLDCRPLLALLTSPARALQRLSVAFRSRDDNVPELHALPEGFLGLDAPRLRSLQLYGVAFVPPVPALSRAPAVRLDSYTEEILPYLGTSFPALSALELARVDYRRWDQQSARSAGVRLRKLHVSFKGRSDAICAHIADTFNAANIRSITVHSVQDASRTLYPILAGLTSRLKVSLTLDLEVGAERLTERPSGGSCHATLRITSMSTGFVRIVRMTNTDAIEDTFALISSVAVNVEQLILSDGLLRAFLRLLPTLPALTRLTVDFDCPVPQGGVGYFEKLPRSI